MAAERVYTVGDATVTRVVDCTVESFSPEKLLPDVVPADWTQQEVLRQTMSVDGARLLLSIHTWVIRDRGRTILVDTGAGNGKPRPNARYFDRLETPYLARLAAAGVTPEEVDYVLLTHLHVDHVGWNTRWADGRWEPTFRNARHIFSGAEYRYFTDPANLDDRNRTSFQVQRDSVSPVVEAGLADLIEAGGQEVIPGFRFHATPGHTPHHASITFESGGESAIFPGDVLHHPIQVFNPALLSLFDPVRGRTLASRAWALGHAADREALFFSSHFSTPSAGRVRREGERFSWRFA